MSRDDLLIVLNALPEPVFLVGENRRIALANRSAQALCGDAIVGRDFVHAIRDPEVLKAIEAALRGETVPPVDYTLPGPVEIVFRVSSMHLAEAAALEATAVVTLADISDIQEAEQMRSDFVANVSHELRSPLTALVGGIETLKGAARDDPAARLRFLDMMEREAARMNRLVGDLLSLSRVEVNARVRPSERVDIAALVEKVAATLETQAGAENRPIRLSRGDGEFIVAGDEDELTQVFHNLIDNALKYGRDGTEVRVSLTRRDQLAGIAGPALAVAVSDQGHGIADEHIPRLTERFYRVDDSRSREKGGTGLGLAIVKHVLNRHRGRLVVESRQGIGSTFTVCLPRLESAKNPPLS